ncbi:monothiol glutaredoxin-S6-like [Fagus crenata]|uniref:Glutaredoxin domain-containing protein n=1 Tax=Fagus sylvatica TaxID=28930 RepID=A0A2N9ECC4_FAGSY
MDSIVPRLVGENPVVIFSKSSCCMSHSIKSLICSYGANPTVYELDRIPNGQQIERALLLLGCRPSVPAVFIGQQFIGGADEVMTLQVKSKLVPLLIRAKAIWLWNGN